MSISARFFPFLYDRFEKACETLLAEDAAVPLEETRTKK
jgi:hypothetical protein